jgi:DNA processing protein
MAQPNEFSSPDTGDSLYSTHALQARGFEGFDREDEAWLRLSFANIPAGRCRAALERWRTPQALLEAARRGRRPELLATRGLSETLVERLLDAVEMDIEPALRAIEAKQIWLLKHGEALYPPALRAIHDAPVLLWVRGTLSPADEIAVGIVGTREVTEYGKGMASRIARDLAQRGVTVVSGLALGVDTWAHRGALEGGGRTLACCGCGLDIVYPAPNRELMQEIVQNGAMISEFPPTMKAAGWHFPARNRIISGLSAGVAVIEAAEKSGALITADYAKEQGREVFALPGNVLKPQSRGPHQLIRDGAHLIEKAQDIVEVLKARSLPFERAPDFTQASAQVVARAAQAEEDTRLGQQRSQSRVANSRQVLGGEREAASSVEAARNLFSTEVEAEVEVEPTRRATPSAARRPATSEVRGDLSAQENKILGALSLDARHIDAIALDAGVGAAEAAATLLMLELKRLARRLPGGMFERLD